MKTDFSQIWPFLTAALVVFVIYRRFRRNFGRQPLLPVRMRVRMVLMLIVGGLLLPSALHSLGLLSALLAGVAAGVALALWGAARTRFLTIDQQRYYVPHTYAGVAVSLLFLGRLLYRLWQVNGTNVAAGGYAAATMMRSPLTLGLFSVLMGYYVCYYSLVLRKSKRVLSEEVSV
jgi:hypothetical protein